uniref:C2H2-type domain-containing protein n=1 Tax=Acrobeloides nanus TaxID=290746 RepID=A0A914EI82_9BILA
MFAGGDFIIQRLLSHPVPSPIPSCSSNSSATSSTFEENMNTPQALNLPDLSIFVSILGKQAQEPPKILQDYSMALQFLQLQMLCQQPNFLQNFVANYQQLEKLKDVNEKLSPAKTDSPRPAPKISQLKEESPKPGDKPPKTSPVSRKRSSMNLNVNPSSNSIGEDQLQLVKRSKISKRFLADDNETNSPVSGMFIKEASDVSADDLLKAAELDDTASYVHISVESRQAIAKIPNVIGETRCSLCKVKYEDVFRLAMHKCPRIIHEEYRCPDCDKTFSCPANLASHRRWHKPKDGSGESNYAFTM